MSAMAEKSNDSASEKSTVSDKISINSVGIFITMIIALIGAFFAVQNYFATKSEVNVLKCRTANQFAVTDSKFDAAELRKKIFLLDAEILELDIKKKKIQARESMDDAIKNIRDEREAYDQSLAHAQELIEKSSDILKYNKCDNESRGDNK